jgi:hypothetical protein
MASLSDSLAWLFIKFVVFFNKKRLKFPKKLANLIKLTPENIISQFVEKNQCSLVWQVRHEGNIRIEQQENRPTKEIAKTHPACLPSDSRAKKLSHGRHDARSQISFLAKTHPTCLPFDSRAKKLSHGCHDARSQISFLAKLCKW